MLATGGKKEAPAQKPTLAQVKDSVKIDASSKYVPSQHSVGDHDADLRAMRACSCALQGGGGVVRAHANSQHIERTVDN